MEPTLVGGNCRFRRVKNHHSPSRIFYFKGVYHRFRARWLSPRLMKWMSSDPLLFAAGDANLSRGFSNDPINRNDPSGLFSFKINFDRGWVAGNMDVVNTSDYVGYSSKITGGGVNISLDYRDPPFVSCSDGKCTDYEFIQMVTATSNDYNLPTDQAFNDPGGYMATDNDPYYHFVDELDATTLMWGRSFYDTPRRHKSGSWNATLTVVCIKSNGSTVNLGTINYGFNIDQNSLVTPTWPYKN